MKNWNVSIKYRKDLWTSNGTLILATTLVIDVLLRESAGLLPKRLLGSSNAIEGRRGSLEEYSVVFFFHKSNFTFPNTVDAYILGNNVG